jgi:hypothetical protein
MTTEGDPMPADDTAKPMASLGAVVPGERVAITGGLLKNTSSLGPIGPALLWAALMLAIMTLWLWARNFDKGVIYYGGTGVLAVISLFLFFWVLKAGFGASGDPGKIAEAQTKMWPLLSLAMLGGGLVLAALAAGLGFTEKLSAFAEVSSLTAMALICIGSGLAFRARPDGAVSRQSILVGLIKFRPQIAIVCLIGGVLVGGLGAYLAFRAGWTEFSLRYPGGPEGAGLFLIGLVFLAGGVFLQSTLHRPATEDTMRILVLYLGSMTGFLIAFFTAIRIGSWWGEYFAAGQSQWQGSDSWRFWLCCYIELGGLLLLFGSLLLAYADIRVNITMRRLLYGYNAVLTGLLLLLMLVVTNIVVAVTLPSNVEWTESLGMHSLSTSSVSALEDLKERVKIYVLMERYVGSYLDVRDLLDNCQSVTNKLTVEYVPPDLETGRYRELKNTYPELSAAAIGGRGARGLLIVYGEGPETKKLPHVFIPEADMKSQDMDPMTGQPKGSLFKGEELLMQALQGLAENKQKVTVYFTQGRGEPLIGDADFRSPARVPDPRIFREAGTGELASRLKKQGFEVKGLVWEAPIAKLTDLFTFSKKSPSDPHEVPADCRVLAIVNPAKAFPKEVLEAIDRYMDKADGKLMILSRQGIVPPEGKFTDDGLDLLCKKYGVQLDKDFTLQLSDDPDDMIEVLATVPANTENKMARLFTKTPIVMVMPRTVKPIKGGNYQADVILEVNDLANRPVWTETEESSVGFLEQFSRWPRVLQQKGQLLERISKEPLPVGVAVTDRDSKPRAIVLGDYSFITSSVLTTSRGGDVNPSYDFFRSGLEWLSERKMAQMGISPRKTNVFPLTKNDIESPARMILLPLGLLVLALVAAGAGVWVVRRQ